MNETLPSSCEWMQPYQQTIDTSFGFFDAAAIAVTTRSFVAADHHLTPKGCISKPFRKRSRASKRTPTTLLNADAKNFRSLVQQFTGCRRRSTSISFGNQKGPVNINFTLAKNHDYYSTDHASILSQPIVDPNYYWKSQLQQQEEHQEQHYQYQQQQLSNEEQERELSFDSITTDHDDLLLKSCLPPSDSDQIPQGFDMDDMYFFA